MQAHNDRWLPFWCKPEFKERQKQRADEQLKKLKAAVSSSTIGPPFYDPEPDLICIEHIGNLEIRFYANDAKSTFFSRILSKMLRW